MRLSGIRLLLAGMTLLSGIVLAGCGEEASPPPPARPAPPPQPSQPVQDQQAPEPVQEPEPPAYVYEPAGRRDPFVNPLAEFQAAAVEPEVPLTPLQKFDLGQLRLIGVIVGKGQPTAMVIAPDGKSFILRKGIKVGKNNGTVVGITREGVQVEEKYYDFSGEVRTNIQELQLPKRGGV